MRGGKIQGFKAKNLNYGFSFFLHFQFHLGKKELYELLMKSFLEVNEGEPRN